MQAASGRTVQSLASLCHHPVQPGTHGPGTVSTTNLEVGQGPSPARTEAAVGDTSKTGREGPGEPGPLGWASE